MKTIFTSLLVFSFIFSDAQVTDVHGYTGVTQTFIVPPCVTSIAFDVKGAQGGDNGPALGGRGGQVEGEIAVSPGDTLYITVGGAGITSLDIPTGGFNGGGGVYSYTTCGSAGTGGGASDIRLNDNSLAGRIAVGGGGGGAGGYVAGNQTYAGGDGGTLIAYDGVPWPGWPNSAGKGGTQIAGGAQGVACCGCPTYTTDGGLGTGGFGAGDCAGGGGGGGGYYGGGGSCFGGAGGGSNYASSSLTNVVHTAGVQTGDGIIILYYTPSVVLPSPAGPVSGPLVVCEGDSGTYFIAPVANATGYNWTVPPGTVINTGQNTISVSVTFGNTSGNITVTPINGCGNGDNASLNVTVNMNPAVSLGADTTQCVQFLLDAQNTGSAYLWNTLDSTQTIMVTVSGTYSVIVTDVNGCSGTDSINVMINPLPVVSLALNPSTVCINWSAYALTGGLPTGGTYSGPGVSAGMFDPNAAGAGTWQITYTFMDTNNCTDSTQQPIIVDLCAGIENVNLQSLNISPNPSHGLFNILFPIQQEETEITIVNYMGQEVFRSGIFTTPLLPYSVDLSDQPPGIYLFQIKYRDSIVTARLVLNK